MNRGLPLIKSFSNKNLSFLYFKWLFIRLYVRVDQHSGCFEKR